MAVYSLNNLQQKDLKMETPKKYQIAAIVDSGDLNLPGDVEDSLWAHLEAGNGSLHLWDRTNTEFDPDFDFKYTDEVNNALNALDIPENLDVYIEISW